MTPEGAVCTLMREPLNRSGSKQRVKVSGIGSSAGAVVTAEIVEALVVVSGGVVPLVVVSGGVDALVVVSGGVERLVVVSGIVAVPVVELGLVVVGHVMGLQPL